jgi:hypothetical protein
MSCDTEHSPSNAHAYRLLLVKEQKSCDLFNLSLKDRIIARSHHSEIKTPDKSPAFYSDISLTMSYFHTGIRTIIGAEAFHCPVRDGKEWDHLAMVIRLKRVASFGAPRRSCEHAGAGRASQFKSQIYVYV